MKHRLTTAEHLLMEAAAHNSKVFMMKKRSLLWLGLFLMLALCGTLALRAQTDASSVLRPPKGAKVALVIFEDLECPDCARAAPVVAAAARQYKIPVVRYDFPLQQHPWAFDAAVLAHYFGEKSEALETEFREYIFAHQTEINPATLRSIADKWAKQHNMSIPFAVDPTGKLKAKVNANRDLGKRIGIQHTPTLYVVSNSKTGRPFVEVVDRSQLYQLIDQMKSEAE
jgi:protein-disulfide isomerase